MQLGDGGNEMTIFVEEIPRVHEALLDELTDRLTGDSFQERDIIAIGVALSKALLRGFNLGAETVRINLRDQLRVVEIHGAVAEEGEDLWLERYGE